MMCWLIGILGGAIVTVPAVLVEPAPRDTMVPAVAFLVILPAQNLTMLVALWWVSRVKGLGAWKADFGLELRWRDADALFVGVGLQVLLTVAITPLARLADRPPRQELLRLIGDNASGLLAIGIVVSTVVLAPLVEELLFRGLLLRALLRRVQPVPAVMISGLLFGVVHLLDFRALLAVPALTVVGATLSVVALRTNSLSRPILIHAGFNLTATVAALAA